MGSSSFSWAGKRVLVTGASSGIGEATALAAAQRGATVGIVARREDRLADVLRRVREHTPQSQMWVADLAELDGIDTLVKHVSEELAGIDVLINNAGAAKRRKGVALTAADLESTMRLNFFSPALLCTAVLPAMLDAGFGRIVNISSMGAHMMAYGTGAYAAAKAALEYFSEALYLELVGTGVEVRVLVPGSTRTEFSLPREGNDPPFPLDPATVAEPADVAEQILAAVSVDDFISFATDRDRATAQQRDSSVNEFLRQARAQFA